ncbi:MAG: hypothetical protein IKN50_03805, partial [Clostridia bacterium]|nr:hypothetical protein [Clostridia bacterium]
MNINYQGLYYFIIQLYNTVFLIVKCGEGIKKRVSGKIDEKKEERERKNERRAVFRIGRGRVV